MALRRKKTKENSLDTLRDLGYEVGEAFTNDDGTVYSIQGFGLSLMASESDTDMLASVIDSHDGRVAQLEE